MHAGIKIMEASLSRGLRLYLIETKHGMEEIISSHRENNNINQSRSLLPSNQATSLYLSTGGIFPNLNPH